MQQDKPFVSVIVPMYNAEKFISETLVSILREKETLIEVIVVNDKSTDRSLDQVRRFHDERIRVIEGPGRGAPAAMNAGLANAKGSVIMICDSDDIYPPTRIRQQGQWLESHPEYGAVCGNYSTIDSKGKLIADMECGDSPIEITDELINGKLRTSFCTYAVRSSLAQKVGCFREFFEAGYDLDFQFRLGEAGRVAYVPDNWYFYRIHPSSITHTQPNFVRQFFERTAFELQHQRRTSGLDDLQRGCLPSKPNFNQLTPLSATDHIQSQLLGRAWREHQVGKKISALRTGVRALLANPLNISVWKSVLAMALKPSRST
jgi:glycosyltransferase involved in cell wall biosynthesis